MLAAEATHRDHANAREGHRRAEERPDRAPTVRANQRERRMAGPRGDLVQPDPRRRDAGLEVPRPGHHRHDPHPPHRRASPHRPLGPPAPASPARAMALGNRLAGNVHRNRRATRPRDLTTQPQRRNQGPEVEDPDRPATHLRPNQKRRGSDPLRPPPKADRWIEVQVGSAALRSDAAATPVQHPVTLGRTRVVRPAHPSGLVAPQAPRGTGHRGCRPRRGRHGRTLTCTIGGARRAWTRQVSP
jgi:hypothetical protein